MTNPTIMNRIIKFRTWYGGKMRQWGFFENPDTSITFVPPIDLTSPHMQFTGLLDRNGKEVYEGDVVRTYANRLGNLSEEERKLVDRIGLKDTDLEIDNLVWEVKDIAGSFCLYRPNPWVWTLGHLLKTQVEIIGNVFENAELLHDKNND